MDSTNPVATPPPENKTGRHSRMALAAALLSIFAFLPPFGIAAVVLGHLSRRRIGASRGMLIGKETALAALIIGYLQMSLVAIVVLVGWRIFDFTVRDFRRDALVQRIFQDADANDTLDHSIAQEKEISARALVFQMVAIQERYHNNNTGYLCSIGELIEVGVDGITAAEKQAFRQRVNQSDYIFELRGCSAGSVSPPTAYKLTAVPRPPRMPEGSLVFCAEETGRIRQISGGTSVDCIEHGYIVQAGGPH